MSFLVLGLNRSSSGRAVRGYLDVRLRHGQRAEMKPVLFVHVVPLKAVHRTWAPRQTSGKPDRKGPWIAETHIRLNSRRAEPC